MVACLWLGVAVVSAGGLVWPRACLALLMFQVVHKAAYLAVFVVPAWRAGGSAAVPRGVAVCFVAIEALWPVVIWMNLRGATSTVL